MAVRGLWCLPAIFRAPFSSFQWLGGICRWLLGDFGVFQSLAVLCFAEYCISLSIAASFDWSTTPLWPNKVIVTASVCCLLIACLVSLIAAVGIRFSLARLHGLGKFFLLVLVG